jgi:hypothetical protein
MARPVPLGAEKILVPPGRSISRAVALHPTEEAGVQIEASSAVCLYVVDEENWGKLRAGQPFRGVAHRQVRSHALAFRASSAGLSHVVVRNPNHTPVRLTLLISI